MLKQLLFTLLLFLLLPVQSVIGSLRISTTKEQLQDACKTSNVKVVFIFDSKIHFIDFSEETPKISQIAATNGAINPVISPDGSIVAYTTGIEDDPPVNVNGNATIYTCRLEADAQPTKVVEGGFVPRFDYSSSDPVLIYSTCAKAPTGKDYCWDGCGKVIRKNLATGETSTIYDGGSYFGGLSFDGRYLATAESKPNAFMLDLQNASQGPSLLHRFKTTGDAYVDLQTCNSSISSSRIFTNTMMYFDFSSLAYEDEAESVHPILGYWDIHQRIFIARNTGAILKIYDVPVDDIKSPPLDQKGQGEVYNVQWAHPEWSNHPYYAAAAVQVDRLWKKTIYEHTFHSEWLYLINLKDSAYLKIAEATDTSFTSTESMRWPWIWIETPSDFSEDPSWLESAINVKKRNHNKILNSKLQLKDRLLKVAGEQITEIRLFTHDGRLLWSKKFANAQSEILLPARQYSNKLILCDIGLKSGKTVSASIITE